MKIPARRSGALLWFVLATTGSIQAQHWESAPPPPTEAIEQITTARSRRHVEVLADDRMLGRNTPSPELDSAANYIAGCLRAYGVEPVDGSYFHTYLLRRDMLGSSNALQVAGDTFAIRESFIPFEFTASGDITATVVFVGYGISRPDEGYDDYESVDVAGKIVLVVAGEPANARSQKSLGLDPGAMEKMRIARDRGAVGFLLVPNPLKSQRLRPTGFPWPSLYPGVQVDALPIVLDCAVSYPSIPSVSVGGDVAETLMPGGIAALTRRVHAIDSSNHPLSTALEVRVRLQISLEPVYYTVRNVVGIIRGTKLANEYVVVGAHYDHVGHFQSISARGGGDVDTIYNGADDNASGCSALLMNAEAFACIDDAERPLRSVVFAFFSGEEKGLYGSRAWVAHPAVPIGETVAMLNMDMIGRNNPDSISVGGYSRSSDMGEISVAANRAEPMLIARNLEDMFYRSDQASFAAQRIPYLHFSSGLHRDYHQVSDTPDLVDYRKLARVARLCFRSAWIIATSPDRPVYDGSEERDRSMLMYNSD